MRVLQLNGISSYTSPLLKNLQVRKGETVRVTEAAAAHMIPLHRLNEEGTEVPFFSIAKDQTKYIHDAVSASELEAELLTRPRAIAAVEKVEDFSHAPADDETGLSQEPETETPDPDGPVNITRPKPRQRPTAR